MFSKLLRLLLIGLSIALISGCGLKGPLEHPKSAHADLQPFKSATLVPTNLT